MLLLGQDSLLSLIPLIRTIKGYFMKFFLLASLAFLTILTPTLAEAYKFKNAVPDPEISDDGFVARKFAEYVEEHTKNKIQVENYYSCALGDETESLRNIQKGSLAFAMGSIANLVPFEKKLGVLTLPYVFDDFDQIIGSTRGRTHDWVNKLTIDKGIRILAWVYNDYRYPSNSIRPIKNINDMKGLKFRVPANAILVKIFEAFGASPTPISWAETFTALQQRVVDGQDIGYFLFKVMKFNEANQKYITEVNHSYLFQLLAVSEKVFSKLSKKEQQVLIDAGKYAQEEGLKYHLAEKKKAKEYLLKNGVQIDTLEDEDVWRQISYDVVWPSMEEFVGGKKTINSYLETLGKKPWKGAN